MLSTSIRGGDLKTISPGDYITCQSSLYKTENFPPILGEGGAPYFSLSTFIECILFYWFIFKYEFSQHSEKIKTCLEKTRPHSFFFVLLGKSTELQKEWKILYFCLRGGKWKLVPPSPHSLWFCGSHKHSHFFTGESRFSHSSSSPGRQYSQPHTAQISVNFCDEFTGWFPPAYCSEPSGHEICRCKVLCNTWKKVTVLWSRVALFRRESEAHCKHLEPDQGNAASESFYLNETHFHSPHKYVSICVLLFS